MHLITKSNQEFLLYSDENELMGSLLYKHHSFKEAKLNISSEQGCIYIKSKTVLLDSISFKDDDIQIITTKAGISNSVVLHLLSRNKQYYLKKNGLWKLRFTLTNDKNEELFALLPIISWSKKTHDYTIQLNEEFRTEISPVLILHAVHNANCILTLMNGLLISI